MPVNWKKDKNINTKEGRTVFSGMSSGGITLIVVSTIVVMLIGTIITAYFTKKTKTSQDWATGGGKTPTIVLVFTMFATQVGGGVLVGHVGIGYSYGLAPLAYATCGIAGLLLMMIAAGWFRKNHFTTIPDIFLKLYGENKVLMILATLMAVVVPFGWIASQIVSFGKMYSAITGIDTTVLIIAFAVICMLFTIPAGFNSVAWSDFIFGLMMLILCCITGYQAIHLGGGWEHIVQSFPEQEHVSFPGGIMGAGLSTTLLWFVAATPGMMTNQMSIQRVCAADSTKSARKVLWLSSIIIVALEIWVVVIALTCRALQPELPSGEDAIGILLPRLPVWTTAMFAGFITTTILTTTDSAMQSVAVNLTNDIYARYVNPGADDKKLMKMSRLFTLFITAAAILLAVNFQQVLNLITSTYSYAASGLLIPIYGGYLLSKKRQLTPACGLVSMISGVVGCFVVSRWFDTFLPAAFYGILISTVAMLVMVFLVKGKANVVKE